MTWKAGLRRNRRTVASATVMSLVLGTVVALSLNYEGVATADVDLNDGGVWVSNNESILVGRLNYPVEEIDATLAALSQDVDLLQREETVLIRDRAGNTLQQVDPVSVGVRGSAVPLPTGSDVQLGDNTVGVLVEETGEWRVLALNQLNVLAEAAEEPQAVLGEGAAQAIADDGTAYGLDVADGELVTFPPGNREEPEVTEFDPGLFADTTTQLTVVGDQPVALAFDPTTEDLTVVRPGEDPVSLTGLDVDGASARLQAPSRDGDKVAVATSDALITVPLDGSTPKVHRSPAAGDPAQPVQVAGCVHSAWAGGPSGYLRQCGDAVPEVLEVPGATGGDLVFRVNRHYVVLNELASGNSWMVEDALILVDNWEDATPPTDQEEEEEEQSQDLEEREVELDRDAENRPPVAQDDQFGARAGRVVVLPVLRNDSDADGDLLTASVSEAIPESFGSVEAVHGGRAIQIRVSPDASGRTSFQYTADDGRGGTDSATVRLEVVPSGTNNPPEQQGDPITAQIAVGESVEVNVLESVIDPDGDALFLAGTTDAAGLQVRPQPDGTVSITHPGGSTGIKSVFVQVTDGRASADVQIDVEVLPDAAQPPTAVFDYATTFVDQTIEINPIANDLDPNDRPLRLANVRSAEGATVRQQDSTFTFSASSAGDYYLVYVVADDDGLSATGLVRVRVLAPENQDPIAASDTAFLPSGGTTLVDVLANDEDPAGGVLGVQQIDVPSGLGLRVAVLEHRILRISTDRTLNEPVTISYTVSNGTRSAEGEVLVQPMATESGTRAPVAVQDETRVRAGDHVTIPVLSNDTHPNGFEFTLDPELSEEPQAGLMFTAGEVIRYQAPQEAGTYTAVYSITDEYGREDSATIRVHVQARAEGANTPPEPRDVDTRAFSGERIRIPIELYGIDPDGDSVQLLGVDEPPALGRIVEVGPSYIDYQAFTDSAGPDQFTYTVRDRMGDIADAQVSVGVIPPPGENRSPVAVDDEIEVPPNRPVEVDVLANDTDPDGDLLTFDNPVVSESAVEDVGSRDGKLTFTSPGNAGEHLVTYHVTDLHGGTASGLLTVTVDPDSPRLPPVAVDDVVPPSAILEQDEVEVQVLPNDTDPDGSVEALTVDVPDDQENARSDDGETVTVTLAPTRQVVTYRVTDEDDLTSYAFIEVPGTEDTGPVLRPGTEVIEVLAGEPETIEINDYVVALSGQPVQLSDTAGVRATNSDGSSPVQDGDTLQYTSDPNYVGPATITFEVTDAEDINDDDILTSVLTLDIMVVSNENQPPRMRDGSVEAEQGGEAVTLDIARLAEDPDGRSTDLEYRIAEEADGFEASLEDYILTVTADEDTPAGSSQDLVIEVTDGESDPVRAVISLRATASNRPLISTNSDDVGEVHQGSSVSVPVLENDSNPFPGEPREILSVAISDGNGTVSVEGDQVVLTPAADFVGRLTATYTVVDVTGEPDRAVEGQITAAVLGVPEAPTIPLIEDVANREVTLSWTAPEDNGASISGYTVTYGSGSQACPTTTCTITGLANGTTYTFTVTAANEVGDSPASPASAEATPDVRPEAPGAPTVEFGDGELDVTWNTPRNEGTPITHYDVQISPADGAGQQQVNQTSMTWDGLTNGQDYTFRVRALNDAPDPGEWSEWSAPEHPSGPPARPAAPRTTRIDDSAGGRLQVEWTAPNNNGAAIQSYELRMYKDGALAQTFTPGGGQTSREVQVQNGHDYHFTLVALNRSGNSETSPASNEVRSFGAPGQTTGVSGEPTGNDNEARISYTAPNNNGQAISRYEYRLNGGSVQNLPSGNPSTISVPRDGQNYRAEVRACNTYCGQWSQPSAAFSTYGPPGEPNVTSSANGREVTFSWTPPGGNGATIERSQFRIWNDGSWSDWRNANPSDSVSRTGSWEEEYRVRVRVVNNHGQQSSVVQRTRSAEADPNPPPPPDPPRMWVTQGRQINCDSGGSGCRTLQLNWSDIPGGDRGNYDVSFSITGDSCGGFSRSGYTENVNSANGNTEIGHAGYTPPHFGANCGGTVNLTISPNGHYAQNSSW
ncbi:Ig-like domain-containing protein [Ruania alba]|uniref:Fibronectin type III domain-containing protein n=1 Tax=Ruania alba TaxID=648782 RepID=A0A1H5F5R5_9MICO|nr:Ig-like domain-containing protein [Ruania alba]SED98732.1 Fibronectin type III domain-containing protein [Ruania alba]